MVYLRHKHDLGVYFESNGEIEAKRPNLDDNKLYHVLLHDG